MEGCQWCYLSHLLKYDSKLADFLNSAEDALKNKYDEIWKCIYGFAEAANCSPQAGLSLVLQTLNWCPAFPGTSLTMRGSP